MILLAAPWGHSLVWHLPIPVDRVCDCLDPVLVQAPDLCPKAWTDPELCLEMTDITAFIISAYLLIQQIRKLGWLRSWVQKGDSGPGRGWWLCSGCPQSPWRCPSRAWDSWLSEPGEPESDEQEPGDQDEKCSQLS